MTETKRTISFHHPESEVSSEAIDTNGTSDQDQPEIPPNQSDKDHPDTPFQNFDKDQPDTQLFTYDELYCLNLSL